MEHTHKNRRYRIATIILLAAILVVVMLIAYDKYSIFGPPYAKDLTPTEQKIELLNSLTRGEDKASYKKSILETISQGTVSAEEKRNILEAIPK